MSLPPELFRHMTPGQIAFVLMIDEAGKRSAEAKSCGAKCSDCLDTGMKRSGSMCGCDAGIKLSCQAYSK